MDEIKPNIGGVRYPSLYNALCYEALSDTRVVFVVAEDQLRIIGFAIGIIDRKRWRYSFLTRHPLIVTRMAFSRILNRLPKLVKIAVVRMNSTKTERQNTNLYVTPGSSNSSWSDSSGQIAKFLYEGVSESHRGKHIARKLGECFFQACTERGATRVDAVILAGNIQGLRLDHSLGFNIYQDGISYFGTRKLP